MFTGGWSKEAPGEFIVELKRIGEAREPPYVAMNAANGPMNHIRAGPDLTSRENLDDQDSARVDAITERSLAWTLNLEQEW
jgi:hypothetical protein